MNKHTDKDTTVDELRRLVDQFVGERNWEQFHTPKNLAMALAIEAAELMEHFQWLTAEESAAARHEPQKLAAVADELADVACYTLALCNALGIDLAAAVQNKMVKNAQKYPADQIRGRYGHDDPRAVEILPDKSAAENE
jgi:dCTP diphosphatase